MKIKNTAAVLALLFLGISAASCQKETEEAGGGDTQKTAYRVINDFEDYKTCIQPLFLLNYFGTAQENTDKKYVKSGEKSLKIVPEGCIAEGEYAPTLKQPMKNEISGEDFSDISQLSMLGAAVYNDSESVVNVTVQLQFFGGYTLSLRTFALQSGWNSLSCNVDPQVADVTYDVKDCKAILFSFDESVTGEAAPTLYLDDVRAYYTERPFTPLDMTVSENEVCSFDKLFQSYVTFANLKYPDFAPTLTINQDMAFSKQGKSLRVSMPKNDGSFTTYAYTGFSFNKRYVNSLGLGSYDQEKYLSFWVYNTGNSQQRLFIEFFDYNGLRYYKDTSLYVPAGQWKQFRYKLGDLSGGATALTTGNAGEIYISWEINSLTENRVLYFDQFEIAG